VIAELHRPTFSIAPPRVPHKESKVPLSPESDLLKLRAWGIATDSRGSCRRSEDERGLTTLFRSASPDEDAVL
jgi:hypothetical protein